MRQLSILGLLVLASAFSSTACTAAAKEGGAATEDDASSTEAALEADNGGMSSADEAPAFGDVKVSSLPDLDPAAPDVADAPGEELPTMRSYHVALLWGHLPAPADASDADVDPKPIDWTGSVSVDHGAIGVKRTIKFDARDRLERRSDKAEVSFVSHTLPFVDGLLLQVVLPAAGPQTLHFQTTALDDDIDLAAIARDGFATKRLDDGRNGLAIAGFADVKGCARGFVMGRWIKMRPALGTFRGRVFDGAGDTLGHVRGIWGHAPKRDKNVFFGKYVSTEGQTRGLFGGTYGDGEGRGIWATRDPRDVGGLELVYSDGYEKDDGRGVWLGRWSERCSQQ